MGSLLGDDFDENCIKVNIDEDYCSYASLLPLEVVIHLMEFLTCSDRIVASQVCQLWYEASLHPKFLKQEKVVVKDYCSTKALAVFRNATRPYLHFMFISVEMSKNMKEFWDKVAPKLKSLYFRYCDINDKQLIEILSASCNLESLTLYNCREVFISGRVLNIPQDAIAVSKALLNVRELSLTGNRYLSDAILSRVMSVMPNLSTISLESCQMSYHAGLFKKYYPNKLFVDNTVLASESVLTFQYFYNIIQKRARVIKNLNLSRTSLDSSALSIISELKELQLKELHVVGCEQLTNAGVLTLARHQTMLMVLDLSYCSRVTDQALINVCTNLSHLRKLAVRNCRAITDLGVVHLQNLINLNDLDISLCEKVTGKGIKNGLCSKVNTRLLKLSLEGLSMITTGTVISLAESLPELTHLNLSYCSNAVTDSSIQSIFQHQRLLRSLKLAFCVAVTDVGLTGMGAGATGDAELNTSSGTEVVTMSQPQLYISLRSKAEEEIIKAVNYRKNVQKVCEMQLSESSRVGYSIAQLKGLQDLDLRHCNQITDVSLKYSFRFLELQHLDLSECQQITHVGLQSIGENNPSIETLILSMCYNITDEGILALTSALHRLKYLDIKGCTQLTQVSVLAIVEHCRQLQYLDAKYCNKMADKISELLQRLPLQTFFCKSDQPVTPPPPPPSLIRRHCT